MKSLYYVFSMSLNLKNQNLKKLPLERLPDLPDFYEENWSRLRGSCDSNEKDFQICSVICLNSHNSSDSNGKDFQICSVICLNSHDSYDSNGKDFQICLVNSTKNCYLSWYLPDLHLESSQCR
eukprot:NODE_188_length_13518_cov_0.721142.p12 type:complete len:123 gc:universal NODE_188_length_13518_cov_0.721142:580-212(-)